MPQTETQTREEWLAGLKVGDEVAIPIDRFKAKLGRFRITAETDTRWIVGDTQFRKVDGCEAGGFGANNPTWGVMCIEPPAVLKGEGKEQ